MYEVSVSTKRLEAYVFDTVQYTDSITHERKYESIAIAVNLESRGVTLVVHPDTFHVDFTDLDSHNTGGGCWFCATRADESDFFKPFIVYSINPSETEINKTTLLSSTIRRSHRIMCKDCFTEFVESVTSNSEFVSNVI